MADGGSSGGSSIRDRRFSGEGAAAVQDYKAWKKWARARLLVEKGRGGKSETFGPMLYTLLEGTAVDALEHVELDELAVDGGEEALFAVLDARYPEREAADRVGDALESVFGLKIEKAELTSAYVGRAQTIFMKAKKEGVEIPDVAQGFLLLRGARLGGDRRAVVLAASERQWTFEKLALALKTVYPKVLPEHSVHLVEDDYVWEAAGEETPPAAGSPEEIEAFLAEVEHDREEPMEEDEAIQVLATWKETRAAVAEERKKRGLPPPQAPDLKRFSARVRCWACKQVGHFSKECPKRAGKGGGKGRFGQKFGAGFVESFFAEEKEADPWSEIKEILEVDEIADHDDEDADDDDEAETFMVHSPGAGVIDPGCARALIGLDTLREPIKVSGNDIEIDEDHKVVTFKGFSGDEQHSIGICKIPWRLGDHIEMVDVYVVPGKAGLLLSKPLLKKLGCTLDMEKDELAFQKLGVRVLLQTTRGGHYEVLLDGSSAVPIVDRDFQLTKWASEFGFEDGGAYDLQTGWDARQREDVSRLFHDLETKDPFLVSCSPPCGKLSPLQALTSEDKRKDPERFEQEVQEAVSFIVLCLVIAVWQMMRGKHFILEQSRGSSAWGLKEMTHFLTEFSPFIAEAAACRFGKLDLVSGVPLAKVWRFASDLPEVAEGVDRQCRGGHEHQDVMDSAGGMRRSVWSQIYPDRLARALVRGVYRARMETHSHARQTTVHEAEAMGVGDQEDDEEAGVEGKERLTRDDLYHGRPQTIEAGLRRLHVNLGHAPVPTMMRHLRHANATEAALKMAAEFRCPECDVKADPKSVRPAAPDIAQPPLRSIGMDVKELPGWMPDQIVKALNIVCDTSSLQSMTPFDEGDDEVAADLAAPVPRPLDPAPPAPEVDPPRQNGKVERHGPWFAQMLRAVIAEVQPQDRGEWRECVAQERAAWRLVESSLRTHTVDLDDMKEKFYSDITADARPPEASPPAGAEPPAADSAEIPAPEDEPGDWPNEETEGDQGNAGSTGASGDSEPAEVRKRLRCKTSVEEAKRPRVESEVPVPPGCVDPVPQAARASVAPKRSLSARRPGRPKQQRVQSVLTVTASPDSDDDDEILAVDTEEVLLARGRRELDRREPRWCSKDGLAKIAQGYAKEYSKLIEKTQAWRPIPLEESRRLRSTQPDRIMKPRPVLTEKEDEEGNVVVKCRMTIQGFKDPDLLELVKAGRTQAPTLSSNGRAFVLQTIASAKFPLAIGDVEGAFLETDASLAPAEHGTIYVSLPSEFLPDGMHGDQLCEVINGYGRSDQPQLWWLTFSKFLIEKLGFVQHPMDPCVLLLFEDVGESVEFDLDEYRVIDGQGAEPLRVARPGDLCGVIGQHVDDGVFGGRGSKWAEALSQLRCRFPYRKWHEKEAEFVGSRLRQLPDYTIVQTQHQYASEEMERVSSPMRAVCWLKHRQSVPCGSSSRPHSPRRAYEQMVKIEAKNSAKGVRSFLEGLAEAGEGSIEGSSNKVKVQIRAGVLDDRLSGKQSVSRITLVYHASTGFITLHPPAALEDGMRDRLKVLESLYHMALKNDQAPPAPPGGSIVVNSFRLPAWDEFSAGYSESQDGPPSSGAGGTQASCRPSRTLRLPRESEFHSGIGDVGVSVCEHMADFPLWRDKILRFLVGECGLQPEMLNEDDPES
ncbi:unnamed protein product [Prorocentrum cordatum]|uniref:CCHC-type domain-containing protein n=1 Tax=Prorocentrum cordatum TaxID=2364126 RepID=A0ABN9PEQ8_9DINO|nr:unnamed protein product [Polarella glacialis]